MAIKKIVRRRRKKSSTKQYFDKNTHNAIVKYQGVSSIPQREQIYVNEILPAFNKLAENLIFIYGFQKTSEFSYEVLKSDCISFLYETLGKFDPTRGTKAFSYFNVVAKNWLIIQSKKTAKNRKRHISIDDTEGTDVQSEYFETFSVDAIQEFRITKLEAMASLFDLMREIKSRLNSDNEIACIDAIMTLFNKIDEIDLLNKRAVFVYMRDLSNLNPKQLSIAMSTIRKHYRDLVKDDRFDIFFGV
tara:strand:- start:100 stop:837 length:738 start_codon:yes stop_codon:yes gene_type:complete